MTTTTFGPGMFAAASREWTLRRATFDTALQTAQTEQQAANTALAEFNLSNVKAETELAANIAILKSARHGVATGSLNMDLLRASGIESDNKDLAHQLAVARVQAADAAVETAEEALQSFEDELAQHYAAVTPPPPGPADPLALLKDAADLLRQGNTQASNVQFDAFVNSGVAFPTATLRATFEQAYAWGLNIGKKRTAYNAVLAWRAANP